MTPGKLQRLAAWVGAAGLALLALAWLGLTLEAARLERVVLEDLRKLPPPPEARPTHVAAPTPGTVGDALLAALAAAPPEIPVEWRKGEPLECMKARDLPLSELPAKCIEVVESQGAWSRALLAASRAERPALPEALETYVREHSENMQRVVMSVLVTSHAVRRAAVDGHADDALAWCADALGLARDMALRQGPTGVMYAAHWTALFTHPCGEAVDAASPAAKRDFARAVDAISAALPSPELVLRAAVADRVALLYGPRFSDAALEALPAELRARIRLTHPDASRFVSPLALRSIVREANALRSVLTAAAGTSADRDAAFARARERLPAERQLGGVDEVMERRDRLTLLLSLLASAARLDAGDATAPAAGISLLVETDSRLLTPNSARLARHAVRLHADGEAPPLAP